MTFVGLFSQVRDGDLPTLVKVFNSYFAQKAPPASFTSSTSSSSSLSTRKVVTMEDDNNDGNNSVGGGGSSSDRASANASSSSSSSVGDFTERKRWAIAHHVSWRALEKAGKVGVESPVVLCFSAFSAPIFIIIFSFKL